MAKTNRTLSLADNAAILAGLRLLQLTLENKTPLPPAIVDVFTDGQLVKPLTADEIDRLAQRINGNLFVAPF